MGRCPDTDIDPLFSFLFYLSVCLSVFSSLFFLFVCFLSVWVLVYFLFALPVSFFFPPLSIFSYFFFF